VSEDCDTGAVLSLLEDEYARAILTATSAEPMSAKTLSEHCDASLPTIYRRLDDLEACDLVEEQVRIRSDGKHYNVYLARLEAFAIGFEDGEVTVDIDRRTVETQDVADRFTNMWEGL
jgi:DNA-binding transcriptional ArsR family regulator